MKKLIEICAIIWDAQRFKIVLGKDVRDLERQNEALKDMLITLHRRTNGYHEVIFYVRAIEKEREEAKKTQDLLRKML